jgi:hypothetical protein
VADPIDLAALGVDASTTVATAWAEIDAIHAEVKAAGGRPSEAQAARLRAAEAAVYLYGPVDSPIEPEGEGG